MEGDWCFQTINFRARMAVRDDVVERTVASSVDRTAQLSFEGEKVTRYLCVEPRPLPAKGCRAEGGRNLSSAQCCATTCAAGVQPWDRR